MEKNRPQLGSGPTYSDSPSDNANSSITSSPTDTLRTSKNSDAKIIKILTPIKANLSMVFSALQALLHPVDAYQQPPSNGRMQCIPTD